MPTSLAAALVLLFGVLPGLPGDTIYRLILGGDWREDTWQRVLRLLGFSFFGLALYTSIAPLLGTPFPLYLSPDYLAAASATPAALRELFGALLGHFICSGATGAGAALAARLLSRRTSLSAFSSGWNYFSFMRVEERWVVISLVTGQAVAGMIDWMDTSVRREERDIVLEEPAMYDQTVENYVSMQYQWLFIPGQLIDSIGVVYNSDLDSRISSPEEKLFSKEVKYAK